MVADHIIVGGGIYGSGTAWELARNGADVTLIESDTIASGASGGLGKRGVRANGRDPRELPLMELAYDLWPKLTDKIGEETGYERTGHLLLFEQENGGLHGGFASAHARQWLQEQKGVPTELIDHDRIHQMEPNLSDDVIGGLYCPKDGVADHTSTTRGLAKTAEREGATIHENTAVVDLKMEGDTVTAVHTNDGKRFEVDTLFLLSNTHVPEFVKEQLGITLPTWRILPQVLSTEPLDSIPTEHLIGHDSRTLAMKEIDGDRVMISGGWRGTWNDDEQRGEVESTQVERNVLEAIATYPSLEGVAVEEADASRPETSCVDHIPIIDRLPGADNMIIGTGWTGHGFAISLAVNQLLSQWALEGEKPKLLEPFTYNRFDSR